MSPSCSLNLRVNPKRLKKKAIQRGRRRNGIVRNTLTPSIWQQTGERPEKATSTEAKDGEIVLIISRVMLALTMTWEFPPEAEGTGAISRKPKESPEVGQDND